MADTTIFETKNGKAYRQGGTLFVSVQRGFIHEMAEAFEALQATYAEHQHQEWTQVPPSEQGEYWHWNGDIDCCPVPMFVLWCGSTDKCFVSRGQLGIEHAIDCEEYGGWWKKMITPKVPKG